MEFILLTIAKTMGKLWFHGISWDLPSGYVKIAIEHGEIVSFPI